MRVVEPEGDDITVEGVKDESARKMEVRERWKCEKDGSARKKRQGGCYKGAAGGLGLESGGRRGGNEEGVEGGRTMRYYSNRKEMKEGRKRKRMVTNGRGGMGVRRGRGGAMIGSEPFGVVSMAQYGTRRSLVISTSIHPNPSQIMK